MLSSSLLLNDFPPHCRTKYMLTPHLNFHHTEPYYLTRLLMRHVIHWCKVFTTKYKFTRKKKKYMWTRNQTEKEKMLTQHRRVIFHLTRKCFVLLANLTTKAKGFTCTPNNKAVNILAAYEAMKF